MSRCLLSFFFFFFNDTATTEIYTLSLHDALPIYRSETEGRGPARAESACGRRRRPDRSERSADQRGGTARLQVRARSEEHTSELQSRLHLVCRLLLEKKKNQKLFHLAPHLADCSL